MDAQTLFALIIATILVDSILGVVKKSPPYLAAPFVRLWKETAYLRNILNNKRFAVWKPEAAHYVALKAIKAQGAKQETPQPVLDLFESFLKRGEPIVLLGEPGAGKTTALEALTYDLARRAYRFDILLWFGLLLIATLLLFVSPLLTLLWLASFFVWDVVVRRVMASLFHATAPLFLEARSANTSDFEMWLDKELKKSFGEKPLFGSYRATLLVDGVNEVQANLHPTFVEGWRTLLQNQHTGVIFTSRAGEDLVSRLNLSNSLTIDDLDDPAVKEFLKVYGREKIVVSKNPYGDEQAKHDFDEMQKKNLLGAKGIGRNPYWLRMVVKSGFYTRNRGKLFYEFAKELVEREINEKPKKPEREPEWKNVPFKIEMDALGSLALAMHREKEVGFSDTDGWNKGREAIRRSLGDEEYSSNDVLGEAEAATLIRTESKKRVEFVHQLVQEFFAAYALRAESNWQSAVAHADDGWWWQTVFMLGGLVGMDGSSETYSKFVQLVLGDSSNDQRLFAAIGLLQSVESPPSDVSNAVVTSFVASVDKNLTPRQQQALQDLVRTLGDEIVDFFATLFSDSDYQVKKKGAALLCAVDNKRACDILVSALSDPNEQHAICEILISVGTSAVNPLIVALRSHNGHVNNIAREALAQIGAPAVEVLIAALDDDDMDMRWQAADVLGHIRDPRAIGPLVAALQDADDFTMVAGALRNIGKLSIKPLIAALGAGDTKGRQGAAMVLSWIGDEQSLETLIASLHDSNSGVRQSAVYGLGKIANTQAVEPLISALSDESLLVRESASLALAKIGDARAVEPLSAALLNLSQGGRDNAAIALGEIGDVRAVEPLIKALQDRDSGVRMCAAKALGKIGDARAVESLIGAIFDEQPHVQHSAIDALTKIGAPAVESLIGSPIVESLVSVLREKDTGLKAIATRALAHIRKSYVSADPTAEAQCNAAYALGLIGDPRALPVLEHLAQKNRGFYFHSRQSVFTLILRLNTIPSTQPDFPPKTRIDLITNSIQSRMWSANVADAARAAAEKIRQRMKEAQLTQMD